MTVKSEIHSLVDNRHIINCKHRSKCSFAGVSQLMHPGLFFSRHRNCIKHARLQSKVIPFSACSVEWLTSSSVSPPLHSSTSPRISPFFLGFKVRLPVYARPSSEHRDTKWESVIIIVPLLSCQCARQKNKRDP